MDRHRGAYYLRFSAIDRAGSMADITRALAQASVSIERIVQRSDRREDASGRKPVVFVTHETEEGKMREALVHLARHEDVAGKPLVIRIEDGESR
jgi:homoserine dehydrogenase